MAAEESATQTRLGKAATILSAWRDAGRVYVAVQVDDEDGHEGRPVQYTASVLEADLARLTAEDQREALIGAARVERRRQLSGGLLDVKMLRGVSVEL